MKIFIAVPARIQSKRLPGKILKDIGGMPMIKRVLLRCSCAKTPDEVVLCTDNKDLAKDANDWGFKSLLTSVDCQSGSDRIASVVSEIVGENRLNESLIINVQGDQPFIEPEVIDLMANNFKNSDNMPAVVTPVYKLSPSKVDNPNIVKTLIAANGRILYFSRSAIPYIRDMDSKDSKNNNFYWGHVGIYGYRGDILKKWKDLPYSPLEKLEQLEQLRLIEAGIEFRSFEVKGKFLSVDTEDQLEEARKIYLEEYKNK
tara:strand:+ start:17 stop:790 length:774 start_codon:yes stop_codon:yes gene_type:complete